MHAPSAPSQYESSWQSAFVVQVLPSRTQLPLVHVSVAAQQTAPHGVEQLGPSSLASRPPSGIRTHRLSTQALPGVQSATLTQVPPGPTLPPPQSQPTNGSTTKSDTSRACDERQRTKVGMRRRYQRRRANSVLAPPRLRIPVSCGRGTRCRRATTRRGRTRAHTAGRGRTCPPGDIEPKTRALLRRCGGGRRPRASPQIGARPGDTYACRVRAVARA
jgi:hypothetical protein